jgi:spore maturation protein CgeB
MTARGHDVLFLERDVDWYASNRDLPSPPYARTRLYGSLDELDECWRAEIQRADCVIVGSYVPDGVAVGDWVLLHAAGIKAFYDIDTPVTLAALEERQPEYLSAPQIPRYDLYLSFSGGPVLDRLHRVYGAQRVRPLYCSFDPEFYHPAEGAVRWELGYMGTYSEDRQRGVERLLLQSADRMPSGSFVVAGSSYPADISWPRNVTRIEHVSQREHREFYTAQRFTLNLTRDAMTRMGYSPSVRLFEAAACGVPIISDSWPGLESFFLPERDLLVAESTDDVLRYLRDFSESDRRSLAERARQRVLNAHTPWHRVTELEQYIAEARDGCKVSA